MKLLCTYVLLYRAVFLVFLRPCCFVSHATALPRAAAVAVSSGAERSFAPAILKPVTLPFTCSYRAAAAAVVVIGVFVFD